MKVWKRRANDYLADLLQALQKQIEGTEELAEFRADELFDIHIGKTPPRKEPEWFSLDRAGNVIWMSIKDMGSGDVYLIDSSEYLTAEAVEKHNVKKCSPGSILLSFKLTIGRVGIAANEMVTNEAIACFSSDDSRKLAYLYPLLKSYDYASLGSTSSIATAVNSRMIKAMTIKMPSSAALDRYYAQTKPIYDLLLDNTREAAALAELRDALLPKLMSGELDVSEVELSTQLNNHLSLPYDPDGTRARWMSGAVPVADGPITGDKGLVPPRGRIYLLDTGSAAARRCKMRVCRTGTRRTPLLPKRPRPCGRARWWRPGGRGSGRCRAGFLGIRPV